MQSFIIISKDQQKAETYAQDVCKKNAIDPFDITIVEPLEENGEKKGKQSIGIEQVRNFQKKLYLKPIKSRQKAVVLKDCDSLTIPSQNALLKTLEEPPENTFIFLLASSKEVFLPTILSRCKVIEQPEVKREVLEEYHTICINLQHYGLGQKLHVAEQYGKTNEQAKLFVENLILSARQEITDQNLETGILQYYIDVLKSLLATYKDLKTTNVSPRFALEDLLLNL